MRSGSSSTSASVRRSSSFRSSERYEGRVPRFAGAFRLCYPAGVTTSLLAGVDPLFAGKLCRLLNGHYLTSTESIDEPALVIADIGRVEPNEVSDAYPEISILGHSSHADLSHPRAAQKVGFDRVVERSLLLESAEALVSDLILPLE